MLACFLNVRLFSLTPFGGNTACAGAGKQAAEDKRAGSRMVVGPAAAAAANRARRVRCAERAVESRCGRTATCGFSGSSTPYMSMPIMTRIILIMKEKQSLSALRCTRVSSHVLCACAKSVRSA
jgi:hypothetical protein